MQEFSKKVLRSLCESRIMRCAGH